MIVHVYRHKGAAYRALKEFIKLNNYNEVDREKLTVVWRGDIHRFIWDKSIEEPYEYFEPTKGSI